MVLDSNVVRERDVFKNDIVSSDTAVTIFQSPSVIMYLLCILSQGVVVLTLLQVSSHIRLVHFPSAS